MRSGAGVITKVLVLVTLRTIAILATTVVT